MNIQINNKTEQEEILKLFKVRTRFYQIYDTHYVWYPYTLCVGDEIELVCIKNFLQDEIIITAEEAKLIKALETRENKNEIRQGKIRFVKTN